ncbi:MAG: 16S rRNA (cytidine(1402)-2'-O)-methyltransferase [Deltaproteobacteria bacterium]|nr:16S rRNA (cytidine(1402)-2'-O)-methyltransferase [Deltaproteobacteria bacterium]
MEGRLYIVATPIGNLDDITLRAIEVLKASDLIAAEDTRRTGKLLSMLGIKKTKMISCFEHNEIKRAGELIAKLKEGLAVSLVTDAGTPAISDPGFRVVKMAAEEGIKVVPIPGVSAVTAALSVSALPTDEFTFKGFLPSAKVQRRKELLTLLGRKGTYVFYESPGRLEKTLSDIEDVLGDVRIFVAREITKLNEEFLRGKVSELRGRLSGIKLKGEITLIIRIEEPPPKSMEEALVLVRELTDKGISVNDAVKVIAKESKIKKSELYIEAIKLKDKH